MGRGIWITVLLVVLTCTAPAADRTSRWRAIWRVSQFMLAGANTVDAASSWGKMEANPLLGRDHRFGSAALGIKLGALAGGFAVQHFVARRKPELVSTFAAANMAGAAALSVVAVHNLQVPRH